MIVHKHIEQNSPEWYDIRLGKITASQYYILKGRSKTRKSLLYKLAAQRVTGVYSDQESFSNIHTARGNNLEPHARTLYWLVTDNMPEEVGFIEHSKYIGCSPDGLISENKGLEIKCFDNHTFMQLMHTKKIPLQYIAQMQFSMYCTGFSSWDFFCYNPHFPKPYYIETYHWQDEFKEEIEKNIARAETEIKKIMGTT